MESKWIGEHDMCEGINCKSLPLLSELPQLYSEVDGWPFFWCRFLGMWIDLRTGYECCLLFTLVILESKPILLAVKLVQHN